MFSTPETSVHVRDESREIVTVHASGAIRSKEFSYCFFDMNLWRIKCRNVQRIRESKRERRRHYARYAIIQIIIRNEVQSTLKMHSPQLLDDFVQVCTLSLNPTVIKTIIYYVPAPRVEVLSDGARLTSAVCLSRTSGRSREQRGLGRLKLAQR